MRQNMSVLIHRDRIANRVRELAMEIGSAYNGQAVVVIGILGGAFVFMADLVRQADFVSQVDFLWLESYEGQKSTGKIKVRQEANVDMQGKDILILDDILDTGLTLGFTREYVLNQGAKSVRAAVLLKKDRENVDPALAENVGFTIPDKFVIGYGLDYNGKYRHLPDICVMEPEKENL